MNATQVIEEVSAQTAAEHHHHDTTHKVGRADQIRIACIGLVILLIWCKCPYSQVLGMVATLVGGYPIFAEAFSNLREKRMTMELSMSIALFAALAISEIFTALVITFFVLIAEALEKLTMGRGRNAIKDLLSLMPQEAFVRTGDAIEEKRIAEISTDSIVVIKPGARIPVDGEVILGHSFVDQSTITGESLPAEKVIGSAVYAGTINQSGTLDVRTISIGEDTAFGKIIQAVESSERYQAPVQKTADRLAGYLVYFALGCAILTFLITHNVNATISVVIVAGACGIAAGTPLAILGGVGRAARSGSIVKGGLFLELLSTVDTVVFDKTGTLTHGLPKVTAIETLGSASVEDLVALAATAESASEHPLGKAVVAKARTEGLVIGRPEQFCYLPGKGIKCLIAGEEVLIGNRALFNAVGYTLGAFKHGSPDSSEVLIGKAGKLLGFIHITDELRTEAHQAVRDLKAMGIKPILLTGDTAEIAHAIAKQLGINEVAAEVLPDEKQAYIKKLKDSGKRVAMVGDGVNDAPALMEATVGVAVGSGTDVARESADIVLIGNDLGRFVETVRIARRCKRIIMTNFAGTLIVDGLGVLLAAFGFLNPLLAAFIHVSSELLFILNSARLLPGIMKQE